VTRYLAILLVFTGAAAGAAEMKLNVDCEIGWQGCYRPLAWTPVNVAVQSAEKRFEGEITLSGSQDELSSLTIAHRCVITPETPYRAALVTKLAYGVPECTLRIANVSDGRVWRKSYDLGVAESAGPALAAVGPGDVLVGFTGRSGFGLRQLGKVTASRRAGDRSPGRGAGGKVYVKERLAPQLPWDWPGYASLDLLVLYDPDWSALREHQKTAIREWVSGGGRAMIILGSHPLGASDPISRMLPLRIGEPHRIDLSEEMVRAWGVSDAGTRSVTCWQVDPTGAPGWKADKRAGGEVLRAWGPVGFGKVAVMAFDPAALGGSQGENLAPFWIEAARGLLDDPVVAARNPKATEEDQYYSYGHDDTARASNAVLNFLLDIPEMEPISILWVVLLLVGLAVVIGPVDYLILRKRDRLPLTWLTLTLYIGVFSVLAYVGVRALRAGATQLRAVSVCDGLEGHENRWSSCYSGIFASATADYRLDGLEPAQWWSAIAPFSEDYYGYYSGSRVASRQITCAQQEGGSRPVYLPVSIWSMQCLLAEECRRTMPIAASVQVKADRVSATIENLADAAVARGCIRFAGERGVEFGPIPARGRIEVEGAPASVPKWHSEDPPGSRLWLFGASAREAFRPDSAYLAKGTLPRTRAIEGYLAEGAAVVCAEYDEAPLSFGLAGRPCKVVHRQLVRLVVFPKRGSP